MFSRFINEIIRRGNEIGSHCKVLWFQKTLLLDLTLRLSIETNQFWGSMCFRILYEVVIKSIYCSISYDSLWENFPIENEDRNLVIPSISIVISFLR